MTDILRVFVGHDDREQIAYDVAEHSINRLCSKPVLIEPIKSRDLSRLGIYRRTATEKNGQLYDDMDGQPFSTDFAFTRFMVPSLTRWSGWAVFVDCDFLFRVDIKELFDLADDQFAVMCVKHDHQPTEVWKMDKQLQTVYPRKNWSSLMLWNCEHPSNAVVTPGVINVEKGSFLHGFKWLKDDEIGELPEEWNWLEGYSSPDIDPKAVHFTRGGPWFNDYQNVQYASEWRSELERMTPLANPRGH